jgi:hypothetical protein
MAQSMRAVGPVKGAPPQLLSGFDLKLLALKAKRSVGDCGQIHGNPIVIFDLTCESPATDALRPVVASVVALP